MGRRASTALYITPLTTAGAEVAPAGGETTLGTSNRGVFTLTAGATYFFPLGVPDAMFIHAHLQGDAAIVITSATLEDSDLDPHEATDYSDNIGEWIATPAAIIESAAEGTGWTATSDVGASAGGNAGGVVWNVLHHGGHRMRLKVVVGATGGEMRLSAWGKE